MINERLLKQIKSRLSLIESPTLKDFLDAGFQTVRDCSTATGIKVSTLYHIWKGSQRPSRANEKLLKAYTHGLVSWDHL